MSVQLDAIRGALNLLGTQAPDTATAKKSNAVPTALTRAALELLAASNPEKLLATQADMKKISSDLFDWSGSPKSTKMVMRGLITALNTKDKYSQAVELTAYIAALAPLLEPDRLARMFTAINEVETAYAPAKYTIQLSHKLKRLLGRYPEERREKLAYSLWVQAHTGRWWDLTAGQPNPDAAQADAANDNQMTLTELLTLFEERHLPWTPATAARISQIKKTDVVLETLASYNSDLIHEKIVDPDTAVLSSHIPWLEPLQRPESPIGSLLDTLDDIITTIEYDMPEKPKSFADLFPDINLYGNTNFPFPTSILMTDGKQLTPAARLEVVQNATTLADNRTFMGNCTWSYKSRMESGNYVLYRIHHNGEIYNGSLVLNGNKWRLGELNSRFNRSQVPTPIREAFNKFITVLPAPTTDNELTRRKEAHEKVKAFRNVKYRYKL